MIKNKHKSKSEMRRHEHMKNNEENKLEPCPFFGNKEILIQKVFKNIHNEIYCNKCNASIQNIDTKQQAIELWNKRDIPISVSLIEGARCGYDTAIDEVLEILKDKVLEYRHAGKYNEEYALVSLIAEIKKLKDLVK